MNSERADRTSTLARESVLDRARSRRAGHLGQRKSHRPVRVLKFGGTSVGDAACIQKVIEIIRAESLESNLVVVVSAMSGVTNKLIQAASYSQSGHLSAAQQIVEDLSVQHHAALNELIEGHVAREQLSCNIGYLLEQCKAWCTSTARTGELTPAVRDLISGLGERLSAPLLATALAAEGIAAEAIEATQLIVTTSHHGAADPVMQPTRDRCEEHLRPMLQKGVIPIVTGFIGATAEGAFTTLGRGGSDYSATIVGAAIGADAVIIWTDVDGILTADPRLVRDARTISEISYREAAELAYFGAKVLHPKTLDPVTRQGIPVWIRNTFAPEKLGTRITAKDGRANAGVKALTAITEATMIEIDLRVAGNTQDVVQRALATTKSLRTDVLMISESAKENHIRLVVAAELAQPTAEVLQREFESDLWSRRIESIKADLQVAILTVVGQDLDAVKGIVEHALEELRQRSVSVIATGQRSSECSVSFVVPSKDIGTALSTTYQAFQMSSLELCCGAPQGIVTPANRMADAAPVPTQNKRRIRAREQEMQFQRWNDSLVTAGEEKPRENSILDEVSFRNMITLERKRTERSRKPMLLMLLDAGNCLPFDKSGRVLSNIISALSLSTRDTDVTGWYKNQSVVGVMFTDISIDDHGEILGTMMYRVSQTMRNNLSLERFSQISISMHVFPQSWLHETSPGNPAFYPDLEQRENTHRGVLAVKRAMDILGSLVGLFFLSPLFLSVALLVKLSSKGPILFKQERLGRFGKPFTFLKFRSMYVNNNPEIHQAFMKRVISGNHDGEVEGENKKVYKMANDPRVTRLGRFIRRTSLDELPQFVNVLKGDMSLVGPRPPLAYECQEYDIWHRRRVLEVKPGITGLWQVRGRSRVQFDDMVRLDLQYVRSWSLWLDIQILLRTPAVVLLGNDAF
jgi:aspartate kinase